MGISSSSRRRNNYRPHHPPSPYYYFPDGSALPPPPPPPPPPDHSYAANPSYQTLLPPPPVHSCSYAPYSSYGYGNPSPNNAAGRFNYHYHYYSHSQQPPYFVNQPNGWFPAMRPVSVSPPPPPPPYVEHQNAMKVRNDVNVHKDTVRLEMDYLNPSHHLVSFVFDALFDGSFTILFFAKEESNCKFVPQFPEVYAPTSVPFQKGLGQKFIQPSGTGVDLGFFVSDDLSKPSPDDVFPLVISAETFSPPDSADASPGNSVSGESVNKQITQAVLERTSDGSLEVKASKQILWINGVRYELRELYGMGSSNTQVESLDDSDPGKECVICMTEPKDTAVLPCRHLCMCSECAKVLRHQSNKCPICREPIEKLLEIKINGDG